MELFSGTDEDKANKQPSPLNIEVFIPWACVQLQVKEPVIVTKVVQSDYVCAVGLSDRSKKKGRKSKVAKNDLDQKKEESFTLGPSLHLDRGSEIQVLALYDSIDHLVHLRFPNNKTIPRVLFKILKLIIQFHEYLSTITINRGLDEYTLYEICKFLPFSHITDICLDNTYLKEGSYYVLLEQKCVLRNLSLSRCSINDTVAESISTTLVYPYPASRTLSILNLASNRITDKGAKCIAEALRSNRQLSYLNLSDNNITDVGGEYLFNTLLQFPLSFAELLSSTSRHMTYLKEKNELVKRIIQDLRSGDTDKRSLKRKSVKPTASLKKKGMERENSGKNIAEAKSLTNIDQAMIDKADMMAENALGPFTDPYDKNNTFLKDSIVYCVGNNTLCYLSLAYNNLTYVSVKKLLSIMLYQKQNGRRPRGLINVSIEGNYMPIACKEITQIDELIEMGLMNQTRRYSVTKKRGPTKPGAR